MKHLSLLLAAALMPLAPALAAESEPRQLGVEADIAFPGYSVRDFEADGDDGIWIEDQRGDWYYGTLTGFCPDLGFVQTIGIDTRGSSRLDKFGAILVDGQRCALTSFVTSAEPLPRDERLRLKKAAREAEAATN